MAGVRLERLESWLPPSTAVLRAMPNTPAQVGMGIAAPLIGALVVATGVLPIEAVAEVVADRDAMFRGAEKHTVVQYAEV